MQLREGASLRTARSEWTCAICGTHIAQRTQYIQYQEPGSPPWSAGERLCLPCGTDKYDKGKDLRVIREQLDNMLRKRTDPQRDS